MKTYRVWMHDEYGYRLAFVMYGDYNALGIIAYRLADKLGCTFEWLEEVGA